MKTLLITTVFICAYVLPSFAQEKTEPIETEPKFRTSEKASKKVFPSSTERNASQETETGEGNAELPYQNRKITDSELIEKREKEKEKNSNTTKPKLLEETLEKRKVENNK